MIEYVEALIIAIALVGTLIFIVASILLFSAVVDRWFDKYKNEKNINEITKRRN